MPTFVAEDLMLGQETLNELTAACSNSGIADPCASAIQLGVSMVDDYTTKYALTDDRYKRLVRALAVYELYRLAGGGVPDAIEKANTAAMRELEGIRDGKFPDLARKGETAGAVTATKAAWGSVPRVAMRDGV